MKYFYSKKFKNLSSSKLLFGIWKSISKKRKLQIVLLFGVMISSGIFELVSLGSVIPFLSVISSPTELNNNKFISKLLFNINFLNDENLIFFFTGLFALAALVAASVRLLNYWLNSRLAALIGSDLSCEVYKRALFQPYIVHVRSNSSELITAATNQISIVVDVLRSILQMVTAIIVSLFLILGIILISWRVAIFFLLLFSFLYILIALVIRKKLVRNSYVIASSTSDQIKALQEGLGFIRDVIINRFQMAYLKIYRNADINQRLRLADNQFLGMFPRYALEAFGIISIAIVATFLVSKDPKTSVFPVLGGLALSAQRLLPSLQIIYSSWAQVKGSKAAQENVLNMMNIPIQKTKEKNKSFDFKEKLSLESVSFSYNDSSPLILRNINLDIYKGERIGLIGKTGSGKSTLVDIFMGLLKPSVGNIKVDDFDLYNDNTEDNLINWRSLIAHVPQNIFLSDCSIAENIAIGCKKSEIDMVHLKRVAKLSKVDEFVETTKNGFNEVVGERGIRLSGGQRQRIGIARALYRKKSILIFDEATSALDSNTENLVMESINNLSRNITLILIAHRISTLNNCDRIIRIEKGQIIKID